MALGVLYTEHPDPADLLRGALRYATYGWHVFPLHSITIGPGGERACTCGDPQCKSPAKHPRTADGFKSATDDHQRIAEWWRRWPLSNVGIRTGQTSGIYVLDVDTPKGGAGTLANLEKQHGQLPETYVVLTGGGGMQFYFTHPGGGLRNSVRTLGAGLDTRGDGGYVAAPPSLHQSGRLYKVQYDRELLAPPAWLLEQVTERQSERAAVIADDLIIHAGDGRNEFLASVAGTMRRRGLSLDSIYAALKSENKLHCAPPLEETEVRKIAESVSKYPPSAPVHPAATTPTEAEPFTLHVETSASFCARPDPPADELLGNLVVRGYRTIIGGHTGEGKTTLTLAIASSIIHAQPLLDFHGTGNARILLIDAEQGERSLKRRLREAGLDTTDQLDIVRVPDGLALDVNTAHVIELERVIGQGGYAAVIADPLYKLHTGDANAEREATDLMRYFDRLRDHHRFALLLPVHCRKPIPGIKFSIHDIFGSSAYVRGAEVVIGLQRIGDGYSRLHFLKDRDGDLPIATSWGLLFNRQDGYKRDPNEGQPSTADKLRDLLGTNPNLTQKQAGDRLGVSDRTVRKYWKDALLSDSPPDDQEELEWQ